MAAHKRCSKGRLLLQQERATAGISEISYNVSSGYKNIYALFMKRGIPSGIFLRAGARGGNWTRDLRITSAFNGYLYDYPRTEDVDKYTDDGLTNSVELCRMRTDVP